MEVRAVGSIFYTHSTAHGPGHGAELALPIHGLAGTIPGKGHI